MRSRTAGVMTTLMRNGRDRRLEKPVKCHARKERVFLVGTRSADHIRASGHSGCIQRPDTWLHPNASLKCQIPLAPRAPSIHGPKRSRAAMQRFVGFSNRPFRVKRFQTIHHYSVDVAHGLVLLFGIGTKALPSWDSKTRWNNLWGGLAVRRTVGPSGHTISPHPSSREGHHSTAQWNSSFLLLD